jgi:hypothetical protein
MKKTILSSAAAILFAIGLSPAIALAGGQHGGKPQTTVTTTTTTVTRTETVPLHPRYIALHRAHSRPAPGHARQQAGYKKPGKHQHQAKHGHPSRDRHAAHGHQGHHGSSGPQVVYREPERHQHHPVGHVEPRNDGRLSVRIGYEIRL